MAKLLKGSTVDMAAARRILQDLYVTEADILPQPRENLLHVRVHNASRPAANAALEQLFDGLNAAEICYPGTIACTVNLDTSIDSRESLC